MNYIEVNCVVEPLHLGREIVRYHLDVMGFESFVDTEDGISAYIQEPEFDNEGLQRINNLEKKEDQPITKISIEHKLIESQNWNQTWEENFDPIEINEDCGIYAPFHERKKIGKHDVIIAPQMSFGTGHHETTHLMCEALFRLDLDGSTVLDAGCGTGVLAILAKKLGAHKAVGVDVDEWAFNNALENLELNKIYGIEIVMGTVEKVVAKRFNYILANINRNALLEEMEVYSKILMSEGRLLLSGFLSSDTQMLKDAAQNLGLTLTAQSEKNNWALIEFRK